ncbi:MAG TPA: flavoprotein [Bdellovibrionota bacterium]|nr:flavoprotein [Bdellovibrionota bacterium]
MNSAKPKGRLPHVVLAVTGCVQAEVTPRLVSNLLYHPEIGRHEVIVAATPAALGFFEREVVEKLIGRKMFVHHTDTTEEFPVPHINLADWADVTLVYPASANTIAKCAHGICDSLVAGLVLAATSPVYFGPTMNRRMYESRVTQRNLKLLKEYGHRFIPQETCRVTVKATGEVEEKLYCTESMVLHVCQELFH